MPEQALVIGSGPAGVACSLALLKQGHSVTMVDVGNRLEPSIQQQTDQLAEKKPSEWAPGASDFMTSATHATIGGVELKTAFGSDFAYRGTEKDIPLARHNTAILPSFARGGLSTVWGAAVLPFQARDLDGWPIGLSDLEPHYRAIFQHVPLAAARDRLEKRFPLYTDLFQSLKPSRQVHSLLGDLEQNCGALESEHVLFGQSRLAVHASNKENDKNNCVYCGLCLYGCPYEAIYSAAHTLRELQKNSLFRYLPGWIAKRVIETKDRVELHGIAQDNRNPQILTGTRIFLAGGVLSTTKILLESMGAYDQPLRMAASQHFMFPWLRYRPEEAVTKEALYTLAQIFLEIDDPEISKHTVHLQFYTYNSLMRQALRKIGIGYLLEANARLRDAVYGRLLVTQGYLHSADSSSIQVTLKKSSSGGDSLLDLQEIAGPQTRKKIDLLLKKLSRLKKLMRAIPVTPLLSVSRPGGGYHAGGTFPMRTSPEAFESDRWGRPYGYSRIHAVDATVLPEIPATAITLNVMANAHRIGSFHD